LVDSEYDFYTFNSLTGGTANITAYLTPSLNALGADRPLAFAIQVDSQTPQTIYPIPLAAPGVLPPVWGGADGFVGANIVRASTQVPMSPGGHTLKVFQCFIIHLTLTQFRLLGLDD
jgi:hypothetical protein